MSFHWLPMLQNPPLPQAIPQEKSSWHDRGPILHPLLYVCPVASPLVFSPHFSWLVMLQIPVSPLMPFHRLMVPARSLAGAGWLPHRPMVVAYLHSFLPPSPSSSSEAFPSSSGSSSSNLKKSCCHGEKGNRSNFMSMHLKIQINLYKMFHHYTM